ncbi:hypothetical protein EYM_04770 [Ignicoccus islandicus DSM 13165]|uniref:Uncharacterized protein n=1 Tax=Ignicoccus islandicus DSM 13165 TaxID=940295 RepID=A0A0U3F4P0_9CREN|nr:hypothetical protein EYM_04770 [Ignicoccus islandicus DSM 13165]
MGNSVILKPLKGDNTLEDAFNSMVEDILWPYVMKALKNTRTLIRATTEHFFVE